MEYRDEIKIERIRDTFDKNYKITQLYALYLERFPELITKEMIDELCADGEISKEDAIGAILTEAFGLDMDKGDERELIRKYIYPSIRILDKNKYYENKYYKNIKTDGIHGESWEFKTETYPAYRAMICDDLVLSDDYTEIAPLGFFTEEFSFPAVTEGGNEWMTLSPVDVDTCEVAIEEAHGRVVTFGLGLGYYAYMVSEKENVESITVVEKSEEVIRLFKEFILPQFTHRDKVQIVNADAFEYAERVMPCEGFDYAFVDTWRDAGDGAPMYLRMKALEHLSGKTEFSYWIENFLYSRVRAERFEELYKEYKDEKIRDFYEFTERLNSRP